MAERRAPRMAVAAGHGLTLANVPPLVRTVEQVVELNIGHALVADAVFLGLDESVRRYREAIEAGLGRRAR